MRLTIQINLLNSYYETLPPKLHFTWIVFAGGSIEGGSFKPAFSGNGGEVDSELSVGVHPRSHPRGIPDGQHLCVLEARV